jgi:hypothetical protein
LLVLLGGALLVIGQLGTIYTLIQYAYLVTLFGLVLAFTGPTAFRLLFMPLLILVFMMPLPQFVLANLSTSCSCCPRARRVVHAAVRTSACSRGQCDRPRRLQAAGCRGLQRAALPVSADDARRS